MLGKEISGQLKGKGHTVISVGRATHNDIRFDLVGTFDPDPYSGLRAEALIHCASSFEGDDPDGVRINFATNTMGCLNVLTLMQALSCRYCLYAGTIVSNDDFEPGKMNSYGLSKALAERILDWGIRREKGKFCSLRLTQLYDTAGACCRHQPWFGRIVAYASRGKDIRMPRSMGGRNYLHVTDAASLLIRALEVELVGFWSVCHAEQLDHAEIARLAYAEFGHGGEVLLDERKLPFRKVNYPDSTALFEKLGRVPVISMADGLKMIHQAGTAADFGPMDVQ